jgi:hypothetical protein
MYSCIRLLNVKPVAGKFQCGLPVVAHACRKLTIHLVPEVQRKFGQVVKLLSQGYFSDARKEWKKGRRHLGKTLDYVRLAMALVIALFGFLV